MTHKEIYASMKHKIRRRLLHFNKKKTSFALSGIYKIFLEHRISPTSSHSSHCTTRMLVYKQLSTHNCMCCTTVCN